MLLWTQKITLFRKTENGYEPHRIDGCRMSEKVEYQAIDGGFVRTKTYTCRIPADAGVVPQTEDIIAKGWDVDPPTIGKDGRYVEMYRAFLVAAVADNTLTDVLPHYKAVSA